jgi:CheY-like chemotaxis protein
MVGSQLAPPPGMETPLRGVHVAVVGDDRDGLDFLAQTLRYHGALVTAHESPRSVLRLMHVLRVNVLVLDLRESVDVAVRLVRSVRALSPDAGGRVPIVVLFAGPPEAESQIVVEDVDSIVRKPVPAAELARVIATVYAATPERGPEPP